jgi:hypothetical protein
MRAAAWRCWRVPGRRLPPPHSHFGRRPSSVEAAAATDSGDNPPSSLLPVQLDGVPFCGVVLQGLGAADEQVLLDRAHSRLRLHLVRRRQLRRAPAAEPCLPCPAQPPSVELLHRRSSAADFKWEDGSGGVNELPSGQNYAGANYSHWGEHRRCVRALPCAALPAAAPPNSSHCVASGSSALPALPCCCRCLLWVLVGPHRYKPAVCICWRRRCS